MAVIQTTTVLITLHVKLENVSIHVQRLEFVLQTRYVGLQDIRQFAHVLMDTLDHLRYHVNFVSFILLFQWL